MFILGISVAGSVFVELRFEFMGLLIHPYLLPLSILSLVAIPRLNTLPPRVFLPFLGFLALYILSTLPARGALGESLKILTSAGTIGATALLVRNRAEFQAGALGLACAAAILSYRGLSGGADVAILGIDPIGDIANRNAFSLYALPSLLLGTFLALDRSARPAIRILVSICASITLIAIFSTGNRSGWLGAILILLMLYSKGRRLRAVIFVAALGLISYALLMKFSSIAALEHRVEQTLAGYQSDRLRRVLFMTSLEVGLEFPLLGVTPQKLPYELARRLNALAPEVDSHNTFGHIMGGSGIFTTLVFLWLGAMLWFRRKGIRPPPEGAFAHRLLRMMLVLFVVRGMFSREILYAPSFSIGLGLCLGYCLMAGTWRPAAHAGEWRSVRLRKTERAAVPEAAP